MNRRAEDWDLHLDQVLFTLRCRRNEATGVTPGKALLGGDLQRTGDWASEAAKHNGPTTMVNDVARDEQHARIASTSCGTNGVTGARRNP